MSKFIITEEMAIKGGNCPCCGSFFRPNGVGPSDSKTLATMLNALPSSSVLRYGANYHDWAYHMGKYWGTRINADILMLMKNEEAIRKLPWWYRWYYRAANKRNYAFVRAMGAEHWDRDDCKPRVIPFYFKEHTSIEACYRK